jgi:hypothetical protein
MTEIAKKINWIIPNSLKELKEEGLKSQILKIIEENIIEEHRNTIHLLVNENILNIIFKEILNNQKKYSLLNILKNFYDISDIATKKKIGELLKFYSNYTYDEIKKQIEEIENRVNYMICNQSGAMNELTKHIYSKKKMNDLCILDTFTKKNATLKTNKLVYTLENFNNFKNRFSITTSKLFIYAVSKIDFNTNISEFNFKNYAETTNVSIHSKNRTQLKNDLTILKSITSLTYENKKKDRLSLRTLIIGADYNKGNVTIEFNKEFAAKLKNTYMYFPKKLLRLKGKYNAKVFILGWYFFTQMRTNFTTDITRAIKKCLDILDFPNIKDIKNNHKREYTKLLINPFENIVDTLSEEIPELYITFDRDYKNINEFMIAQINVELKNEAIANRYKDQNKKKKKKRIQHNIDKKLKNISLAKEYKEKGLNIKEISEKLKLSTRTVKRYFGQK